MKNFQTVLLLGAGASAGAENSSLPITSNFFKKAEEIGLTKEILFISILNYISNFYGISKNDLILRKDIDLEVMMSLFDLSCYDKIFSHSVGELIKKKGESLEIDVLGSPGNLKRMIVRLLQKCGNDFECKYHDILCNNLNHKDTIISYNYDLFIDEALSQTGKWNEFDGYTIKPKGIFKDGGWALKPPHKKSTWPLFKMHGSMNWVRPRYETNTDEYAEELLTREAHIFIIDKNTIKESKIRYPKCKTEELLNFQIIPPMLGKVYYPGIFKQIWSRAFDAISKCNHMVIIGYSLRAADIESKWLLSVARKQSEVELEELEIVDPNADKLEVKLSSMLKPKRTKKWNTLAEYTTSLV